MNFIIRTIFIVQFVSSTFIGFTQEIDSVIVEGKQYYVYPFRVPVTTHSTYRNVVAIDQMIEFALDNYQREIKKEMGDEFDPDQFRKLLKSIDSRSKEKMYKENQLKKAIRKNPYPLIYAQYSFSHDITPVLDPIPDGEYLQYFEATCVLNDEGKCSNSADVLAGRFTIKNGLLEGQGVWYDLKGDTLKYGAFEEGLKTGKWYLQRIRPSSYSLGEYDIEKYIEFGFPEMDTTTEVAEYANGAKNGRYLYFNNSKYPIREGYYLNGEESGTWIVRRPQTTRRGSGIYSWDNEKITGSYQMVEDPFDSVNVVRKIWIRNGTVDYYNLGYPDFNFYARYDLPELPEDLMTPNFKVDPLIELEEEEYNSYDDGPSELDYYEDEYYYEELYSPYQKKYFDQSVDSYRKRGVINDSIGFRLNFTGTYILKYPNGQLCTKWNFDKDSGVIDDTIFWDNGVVHDLIEFDADSNQYVRSVFDYEGKLYRKLIYDSLGDYSHIGFEFDPRKSIEIDGLKLYEPNYGQNYEYYKGDTLTSELSEPVVLYRSWSYKDKSEIDNETYYPEERRLIQTTRSMLGNKRRISHFVFSEDYNSWTGKDSLFAGPLLLISTNSASAYEGWEIDTIPQTNVNFPYERYNITSDYQIQKKKGNYTGEVEINFDKYRFDISRKGMTIDLPRNTKRTYRARSKIIRSYLKRGRVSDRLLQSCLSNTDDDIDFTSFFFSAFFGEPLSNAFSFYDDFYGYYDYGYGNYNKSSKESVKQLVGYMHEGKPTGEWIAYDGKGNIKVIANFLDGELNGKFQRYKYAFPSDGEYYDIYEVNYPFSDTFPAKATHYLEEEIDYKNGMIDGYYKRYNWLGELTDISEYKEDYRNGLTIERNKLAYTKMNFLDGMLDGYLQTYLHLHDQDTILLYDINFQNGLLQGESKAYHLNGNLAKRGFFLNGEPIEDYEAYDSLGFKYHYVKFKYSYPIEEKIWEENELSVKYNFDWRDSIYFEPSDITSSQSLESMLYDLGIGADYLEQPYYGRPSLINKSDILYEMTKYFPNDQVARHGFIENGRKTGCWSYFNYDGEFLYEVDYFDSIVAVNDSVRFKIKGVLTDYEDGTTNPLYKAYIIEKFEKYDCSHSDHYEIRQLWTQEDYSETQNHINGYVTNYYDNGTIQSEGQMVDGLPSGFWKIYDPFGKLNQYGAYVLGKRNGRWLSGDLSKTKYLGDICLNPNLPDYDSELAYRENLLNVKITTYVLGKVTSTQYYDINMNRFMEDEELEEE